MLDTPEFFFEMEMKRLAAETHPSEKAQLAPPSPDNDGPDLYARQVAKAEAAEFSEAIKSGYLHPPDPEKAKRANDEMRRRIIGLADNKGAADEAKPTEEFPSEFADYHRGALAFHNAGKAEAKTAWTALLSRPDRERHYRTTWANYMCGMVALDDKDWKSARDYFHQTREAARSGFADSTGLAAASLGWEAFTYLDEKNYAEATRLYLEQLAAGDSSAVDSLKTVVTSAMGKDMDMPALAKDPILRRLVTATILSGISAVISQTGDESYEKLSKLWLETVESADLKAVKDGGQIGWIAYQQGNFPLAARWLKRADPAEPYTLWLQAKLAMRDGKLDEAAKFLSKAVPQILPDLHLESRYKVADEPMPIQTAKGELGIIRIGHGEFLSALKTFAGAGLNQDAEYLAEAVVTLPELKDLVDREYPPPPPPKTGEGENPETREEYPRDETGRALRGALARRLIRAGQFKEARTYLPHEYQETLDKYVELLQKTKRPRLSKEAKIAALLEAAIFIRSDGEPLFDFFDPATMMRRLNGHQVAEAAYPVIALKPTSDKAVFSPPVTKEERALLKKNTSAPLHHRLSLYMAADFGWQAAALMPDNDEHTAKTLNIIGSWLKAKDDDAADRFYQAIERRCSKTETGKEAIKRHWFVPGDEDGEPTPE